MSSRLRLEPYVAQAARWPRAGKHVMAQFDADSVVVYQAYRPAIGRFAATHGWFGGDFSLARMSWIKPNFLWMMYRSGWGQQANQEVVLAVWLRRDAFDEILAQAVASSFGASGLVDRAAWQAAVARSSSATSLIHPLACGCGRAPRVPRARPGGAPAPTPPPVRA